MSFYSQKTVQNIVIPIHQLKVVLIVVLFHKFYDQSNVKSATRSWKHKFGAIVRVKGTRAL